MTQTRARSQQRPLMERVWAHRHFYLFISPFFLLFAVFGLYPLVYSLYMSFLEWDGLNEPQWIGLANFVTLAQDAQFVDALITTVILGVMYVPPMLILAFLFAVMLNQQWLKLRALWRAAVFIPCITPMVVIAIVFALLFGYETGLVNWLLRTVLGWFGVYYAGVPWLQTGWWARVTVSILLVWRWTGYNMVIMLAGLQGIPGEMYEAATIDGAGRARQLWHLTLPMMRPVITFCVVMSMLGTVYMFDEVFVLTQGGPGSATTNFGLYLFNEAFTYFRFGYASAAAYTVALILFVLTMIVVRQGKSATE